MSKNSTDIQDLLQAAAKLVDGDAREVLEVLGFDLARQVASGIPTLRAQKMIAAAHAHVRQGPWLESWGKPDKQVRRANAVHVVTDAGRRVRDGEPADASVTRMLAFLAEHDPVFADFARDPSVVADLAQDIRMWSASKAKGRMTSEALLAKWLVEHVGADALEMEIAVEGEAEDAARERIRKVLVAAVSATKSLSP